MTTRDAWADLAELLQNSSLRPRLHPGRVGKSPLYDPLYRMSIISCTFTVCAQDNTINTQRLKLYQFVAARPNLLGPVTKWVESYKNHDSSQSENWALMPRGYMQDTLHDRVVNYLILIGELRREGSNKLRYASGENGILNNIKAAVAADETMFQSEIRVLKALALFRIPQRLLGDT